MHKERLTIKPRLQSVSGRIYVARETGPPIPWPQLILLAVLGTAAIVSCSFLLYATDDDGAALLAPAPLLSIQSLGIARGLLFLILAHRIFLILFVRPPIDIKIDYQPGSKLKSMGSQVLAGVGRLATFTIQTWTLQTIYFGLVMLATFGYIQSYRQISYLFELLFATSHLVSCVTSYVLVPTMCKQWLKGDLGRIKVSEIPLLGVDQLTVHNFNIVSLHIDAFLSGQRLILSHWGLALSYASYYAAFAWARCRFINGQVCFGVSSRRRCPASVACPLHAIDASTASESVAPSLTPSTQVPYFFLDYSLPTKRAYAFHLGLAAILTVYFLGFSVLLERMASLGVPWRFAVHAAVCYSNMRLRAPKAYLDIEKKRAEKSS